MENVSDNPHWTAPGDARIKSFQQNAVLTLGEWGCLLYNGPNLAMEAK